MYFLKLINEYILWDKGTSDPCTGFDFVLEGCLLARPITHLISIQVLINCFSRNEIYYTNVVLLLLWANRVVICIARNQLINTSMEINLGVRCLSLYTSELGDMWLWVGVPWAFSALVEHQPILSLSVNIRQSSPECGLGFGHFLVEGINVFPFR